MSNFTDYAKDELKLAGLFDEDGDFYGGMIGEAVMELIEVFDKQGHSGMSAPMVINIFSTLAKYKPLTPIEDDLWNEVGVKVWQNKRLSALFKDETGRAHYLDAIVWEDKDGYCFTGRINGI